MTDPEFKRLVSLVNRELKTAYDASYDLHGSRNHDNTFINRGIVQKLEGAIRRAKSNLGKVKKALRKDDLL